jgi:transglutaminase-like putative cysteine protease
MRMPLAPRTSRLGLIPDGPRGIADTLKMMGALVRANKTDVENIRDLAVRLCSGLTQKDYSGEVRALHAFVRDHIRYIQDVTDVETLQMPQITLATGAGDCDDKSVLLATMLESIGHPTKFVAIGFDPSVYEHVYVETRIGPRWIALETTEPWQPGQEPPYGLVKARMEFVN